MTGVGPYEPGQENRFKNDMVRYWRREERKTCFYIETASTAPGFPDVLVVWPDPGQDHDRHAEFVEFKVSDRKGVITFQRAQPLFYRKHPRLDIHILAWNVPAGVMVWVDPADVAAAESLRYRL